jgi:hypothetical protein
MKDLTGELPAALTPSGQQPFAGGDGSPAAMTAPGSPPGPGIETAMAATGLPVAPPARNPSRLSIPEGWRAPQDLADWPQP